MGATSPTVGTEVRVFCLHRAEPEGGWPGKVAVVLPLAIWVEYDGTIAGFRHVTRESNDMFGCQWFRTLDDGVSPEQVEQDRAERLARR